MSRQAPAAGFPFPVSVSDTGRRQGAAFGIHFANTEPTVYTSTLTVTATSVAALSRRTSLSRANTVTVTATRLLGVNKTVSAVAVVTASVAKAAARNFTSTVTSTASVAKSTTKVLTNTVTSTAGLAKAVGKILTDTVTAVASIVSTFNPFVEETPPVFVPGGHHVGPQPRPFLNVPVIRRNATAPGDLVRWSVRLRPGLAIAVDMRVGRVSGNAVTTAVTLGSITTLKSGLASGQDRLSEDEAFILSLALND